MLQSILTLTLRNFFRNLSYSFITLSGLVVGLTTFILIYIWVTYELGYDQYHPDNNRTFAVLTHTPVDGEVETRDEISAPIIDFLITGIPEVENATRIDNTGAQLKFELKSVIKDGIYADTGYFHVFNTAILAGDRDHLFPDNHSIAISRRLAGTLFVDGDALGKTISLGPNADFKVTGIYATYPDNCSLSYIEFVLPFNAKKREFAEWHNHYVKLSDPSSREIVEQKINNKLREFPDEQTTTSMLFSLTDWRLYWAFENGVQSGGGIVYVFIFGITALFILFMACVNYVNLATARAAKRAKEIGVRKMTGATQKVLVRQFLLESLSITFVATAVSVLLAYLLLPLFNQLMRTSLTFSLTDPMLLPGLFGVAIFSGLIAGSYPALLLSSLKPATVLKGNLHSALTGAGLRKGLVVFQFAMSIILIFSATVMRQQTNFLLKKDLGFDKSQVINVWLDDEVSLPLAGLRTEVLSHTSVVSAGYGGASPMEVNGYAEVRWPEMTGNPVLIYGASVDFDYLTVLKFNLLQGRNFSRDYPADSSNYIVTKKAAEILGFSDPIGQKISYNMFGIHHGEIIGVIDDFHNEDIHAPIDPVIFAMSTPRNLRNLFVRYEDGKLDEALAHVRKVFEKYQPGVPVNYSFLDSDFEAQFYREKKLGNLSSVFTIIAITISCLGLFGLTLFNAQRRTKEIGIRKVLGASVREVMTLLCRDFLKPVLLSFLFAFPAGYILMQKFLEGYAFRIGISAIPFLFVGTMMAMLVLLTVSYHSFQASVRNPVDALRSE